MVKRIFVEKKKGYDIEAQGMFRDLKQNLKIEGLTGIRIIICYDVEGIDKKQYEKARNTIFSEPQVDVAYDEIIRLSEDERVFAVQYLPGQYDQQADFAAQCLQILTTGEKPVVRVSRVIAASGDITDEDFNRIKSYCINPIESHEVSLDKPETLETDYVKSHGEKTVEGFIDKTEQELAGLIDELSLAMDVEDIKFCRRYFKDREKRNPTLTELRMIDTYWSDHCRHTTFLTKLEKVEFEDEFIKNVFESYRQDRSQIYRDNQKSISLMDIATLAMKKLKAEGMLSALDLSDEINACSIKVDAEIDGEKVPYLVMFKNETHNHPTEIEPFGGAATCLGGAIRDPLSGRSYVYQAMRVTGSGDPRRPVEQTLPGKLPQRKITTTAAAGYSSYGNQIGLATGLVNEIYDEGYVAKRMEIGAVIGAAPSYNVVRKAPKAGDVVILLGGATGRDGCGGATGSSKAHTEKSLLLCGAEVQKGNPPEERKIQRLFRNPEATRLIKRCNDFGAGGVSVAIGELADGLVIDLDRVPKKYEGLTGTELAISESQERMAVVVDKDDEDRFIALAGSENLSATPVARVTDEKRLVMKSEGKIIVDISRSFLNTNGAEKSAVARVATADCSSFFKADVSSDVKDKWLETLSDLNVCSQKGLVERFDSSIGAASVLMPFGGKYQLTPEQAMVSKIPVLNGDTDTATIMTFGYNPGISKLSPFHGAVYAIVESISKLVAAGGNYKNAYLTLQEYFERLGSDPLRWGKPVAALLGAYYTQVKLGIAAIGGKDSMSGTFNDIDVPPTLVSFAVAAENAGNIISGEFKKDASPVVLVKIKTDKNNLPDFDDLAEKYEKIYNLIKDGKVLSAYAVKGGGLCEAISKMAFGNKIGFKFAEIKKEELFYPYYGSIVLELSENLNFGEYIGTTTSEGVICAGDFKATVDELINVWQQPLESVFPTAVDGALGAAEKFEFQIKNKKHSKYTFAKPRVFIPVFPGTNCEYDTQRAFEKAGAECDIFVMKNLTPADIESSIEEMSRRINKAQIVMLPGGFSAGDEPGGSGKFIATVFRNPIIKEDILNLLYKRDGLMLGICNGFQALIKLGLVPYGEIRDMDSSCPTLTYNTIGRHVSTMVRTVVSSNLSPWLYESQVGEIHTIPVSHGEGRFVASDEMIKSLSENGQIATQYVDFDGNPTYDIRYNPNGSVCAVEGITSPDGRVLGKMGHSERTGKHVAINVPGSKEQKIFVSGVNYFK
jgi:phosphoribosylformylglycinamidine synthase